MTEPHFELQETNSEGLPIGEPLRLFTVTSVIFNSHHKCSQSQIRHLAEIARCAPDAPVDLSAFEGDHLLWSARLQWRGPAEKPSAARFI